MTDKTSIDKLAEEIKHIVCDNAAYHPKFGVRRLGMCPTCGGSLVRLNINSQLFQSLWESCEHCYVEGHPWFNDEPGVPVPCLQCGSVGWVRSSLGKSALLLPETTQARPFLHNGIIYGGARGYVVVGHHKWNPTWLEALADAVLSAPKRGLTSG